MKEKWWKARKRGGGERGEDDGKDEKRDENAYENDYLFRTVKTETRKQSKEWREMR